MPKKELFTGLVLSLLICLSLIPTLLVTGVYEQIPLPLPVIFIGFPILSFIGLSVAYTIGKKIKIFWQIAKFGLVGVSNTAIDFGILNVLILLTGVTAGIGIVFINALSFTAALLNSYFWNKTWVFKQEKKSNFYAFLFVTIIGMSLNSGIVFLITTYFSPMFDLSVTQWANLAKAFATIVSLLWNFAGYKLVVFKSR